MIYNEESDYKKVIKGALTASFIFIIGTITAAGVYFIITGSIFIKKNYFRPLSSNEKQLELKVLNLENRVRFLERYMIKRKNK